MYIFAAILAILLLLAEAADEEYIVFPTDRRNPRQCSATNDRLLSLGLTSVKRYDSPTRGVTEFWLVKAALEEITLIGRVYGVRDVFENNKHWTTNCGSMLRDSSSDEEAVEASNSTLGPIAANASTSNSPMAPAPVPKRIVMQRDAPQDLDLVSWKSGLPLPYRMKGYVYDVLMGTGTYIYVIGGGINLQHRDFVESRREGWYFGPNAQQTFRDDSSPPGYTSCSASKAAGWLNGISKNSKIISVKSSASLADNTWAFARVLEDITSRRERRGKTVILYPRCSYQSDGGDRDTREWYYIRRLMRELFNLDVVIVTCAGDDAQYLPRGRRNIPNRIPAIWATLNFPLIVAGAVTNAGAYSKFSQGQDDSYDIAWASGDGVTCASNFASRDQNVRSTGVAAGMVAGLAAYFLSWPQRPGHVAADMRMMLSNRSSRPIIPRVYPNVIWNFQDGSIDPNNGHSLVSNPDVLMNQSSDGISASAIGVTSS